MQKYNFPVEFYWFKTCPITFSEEHTLRVFDNTFLRGILGPRRVGEDQESGGNYIFCLEKRNISKKK
jgi:hypothetical protein